MRCVLFSHWNTVFDKGERTSGIFLQVLSYAIGHSNY